VEIARVTDAEMGLAPLFLAPVSKRQKNEMLSDGWVRMAVFGTESVECTERPQSDDQTGGAVTSYLLRRIHPRSL
jgi:hypothetical protein